MISSKKKKKTKENQEVDCSGLISVAGFYAARALIPGRVSSKCIRTHLGIERNILSGNKRRNNGSGKAQNCELCPHEPTLVEVKRLKGEGSKRVDVSIAVNNPGAKQNPDEVGVCNVRDF